MALAKAIARDSVRLLGWSDPREYEAGTIPNSSIRFDAGVSMRVCVGTGVHDFTVLKVKTGNVPAVVEVLKSCTPGVSMVIEYTEGRDGRPPELLKLEREPATAGASVK